MKKAIAAFTALTVLGGCLMTGCINRHDDVEESTEETTRRRDREVDPNRDEPLHDLSSVELTMTFDDLYVEPFTGEPWVLENNIPFTNGNVNTYFSQFLTDSAGNEISADILNNVATIYRPRVRHYPAEQDGYTIYEITYSEVFPMSAQPDYVINNMGTMWSYHNVGFLDYYTGTEYPRIDMSTDVDSVCVTGNVIYDGQTYTVSYYEFREDEDLTNEITYDEYGHEIWDLEVCIDSTVYIVVPDGYDGVVMYVYTACDPDMTFEEAMEGNEDEFHEAAVFGSDGEERIEDYAFLSIVELG